MQRGRQRVLAQGATKVIHFDTRVCLLLAVRAGDIHARVFGAIPVPPVLLKT